MSKFLESSLQFNQCQSEIHITFEEGVHSSCLSLVLSAQPTRLQDLQVTLDASEANAKTLRPARHSDVLSRAPDISILEDSAWVQLFKLFNISDQIMSVVDEFAKVRTAHHSHCSRIDNS